MSEWTTIGLVLAVNQVAMMSPGPDFLVVLRNALVHGGRAGLMTVLGIVTGLAFHMTYCMAGIALVISQSILLFSIIKWIGAAYLMYIGWHALRSKGMDIVAMKRGLAGETRAPIKAAKAYKMGLITNLFNPKATLFFLALWSQVIGPSSIPLAHQIVLSGAILLIATIWFSFVTMVMITPSIRSAYARASKWVDRVAGGLFIALGLKLAVEKL